MVGLKNRAFKKGIIVALLIVVVATLTGITVPSVSITEGGHLSFGSDIALAVNNPPTSEITEQRYQAGDEVIEKRTRNSKTHWLGGNSYSWDGTIGSIHYEDNGWQEIDNYFEPAVAPWDWQMLHAGYHIRVKGDFTAGQIIEFEKQGETVQFQPMALEWTNDLDMIQQISMPQSVTPIITNPEVDLLPVVGMPSHQGTIRWDGAYGQGIDFEWKCSATRLLKIFTVSGLNDLPPPEQYILDGGNPVLRLNLIFDPSKGVDIYVDGNRWNKSSKVQTFGIVEFRKDGEVLWGFMPLRYWDSGENEGQSVATLEKRGNKLYISIRVPHDWLQSAVYPVFIDVDVDKEPEAGADDGETRGDTEDYNNSNTKMHTGNYQASSSDEDSWIRFPGVVISSGATIDVAYYNPYISNRDNGNDTRIYADDQADPDAPVDYADHRGRSRTTNSTYWAITGTKRQESPSIVDVIQELVDSYDYSEGKPIQLLHDADVLGDYRGIRVNTFEQGGIYKPRLHIEYSEVAETDISNEPDSEDLGVVAPNTTYYAYGSAPSNPVEDGECTFTVTNNSGANVDITVEADNFTGGVGWALTSGAPGENTVKMIAYYSGQDPASGVTLTTSPQAFISALADNASELWDFSLTTGTFTDGAEKTSLITLSASLS